MAKRYYWLKLKTDFFNQLKIKKMRKLPHGIDVLIIYLKLLLLSVPTDGIVEFIGLEDAFSEELSLAIDEDAEKACLLCSDAGGVIGTLRKIRDERPECFEY